MATNVSGYLPNDRPEAGRLVLLGLQHVVTMFPATVLVALLCGFHPSTVLLGAGVSTIVALFLSKRGIGMFIPLFYGSSFSYIAAYLGIAQAMGHKVQFGVPAPDDVIALMQAGIICTGILNVIVGFVIKKRRQGEARPRAAAGGHRLGRVRDRHRPREGGARHVAHRRARLLGHRARHADRDGGVLVPAPGQGLRRHAADPARRDRRLRADARRRARPDQLQERRRDAVFVAPHLTCAGVHRADGGHRDLQHQHHGASPPSRSRPRTCTR